MYAKYAGFKSVGDVPFERVFIMMKDPLNRAHSEALLKDMRESINSDRDQRIKVFNHSETADTMAQVETILNVIFNLIIAITMFLCFFSLSSSMSANLYEQAKELGVLRAIGLTRNRIIMLYIYEAFILVMASSLLGILIGTMVGFTMTLQQILFTEIPLIFYFPW